MSKIGTWSCVLQVDSRQFSNIPMAPDNDFHIELDKNPSAVRRKDQWKYSNWIPGEVRLENFFVDVDTVDENHCLKEVILGTVVDRKGSPNYNGWSIVVRTVIRWEEQRIKRKLRVFTNHKPSLNTNDKPADIQRWEEQHGEFKPSRSRRRNTRRNKGRSA